MQHMHLPFHLLQCYKWCSSVKLVVAIWRLHMSLKKNYFLIGV